MAQRRRWRLLSVFLALLALSHFYCWEWPPAGTPRPGQVRMDAPVFDADGDDTGDTTPLYYFDLAPAGKPDAPVLVLIHGSWGASGKLDALVHELAPDFHLIVPDLPGFGASAAGSLPDYSAATDAQEIGVLLDHLGIERANIAGFGMGGGVALEFADMSPARVQSLELIDSIGVVEFQWLGDKGLNHALYGTQLWALTTARVLLPHFGWLDSGPINPA
jgi:pimeloyl-ACP methyl ester carboxylesterase